MNFDEFKTDALRTESKPETLNFSRTGMHTLLECGIKMAKIADIAKKTMFYGKALNTSEFEFAIQDLILSLEELHDKAKKIESKDDWLNTYWEPNLRIAHGAIGMFGESGELLEAVAKQMRTGILDMVNVGEEVGDSLWYAAIISDESGVSEDQARERVIAKLRKRYGEKFSSEKALNRDLAAERKVLEGESA
jgi:NTP pyrophosphatase (non-canonical NTP hydrolase)